MELTITLKIEEKNSTAHLQFVEVDSTNRHA